MTFEKIQENFVNTLLEFNISEQEALKTTSTFFFAWVKSQNGKKLNPDTYYLAVQEFLSRFKEAV